MITPRLLTAAESPSLEIQEITNSNAQKRISWKPYPATDRYKVLRTDSVLNPFLEDTTGTMEGFEWRTPASTSNAFFQVEAMTLPEEDLLVANVLNRLTYGPTPDEVERIRAMGAQAYIDEQLSPESILENLDIDQGATGTNWRQAVVTGTAPSSILYLYLSSPGEIYIDDLVLVRGTNLVTGTNVLVNGDFEAQLGNGWLLSSNFFQSRVVTDVKRSGFGSLHLVATAAGSGQSNAVWQVITPSLSSGATYTLSYWYLPPAGGITDLTVRLSGSGFVSNPDSLMTRLESGRAVIDDLRAWHVLRAVKSRRQLLEILLQFFENHFVTQYDKSREYLARFYSGDNDNRAAVNLEYKENRRWRQALLNPACTFEQLSRISAESPAMIIYLDSVTSRGDGNFVANENYARELLELFCNGVDNGYDQNDIVEMSKVWSGWRIQYVHPTNEFNPFAPLTSTILPGLTNPATNDYANLLGVWTMNYRTDRHHNRAKTIFPGKVVPDRFGDPWAGRPYELAFPQQSGTNTIQEGYAAIRHLADLPFTQEYISVKLCRLFIHDEFVHGVYDYTDPNLSAEAALIRQCMLAWENGSPKGQIRDVLRVIFNSELFRSHGGSLQKVKTPLEFTVSAVRALRATDANGILTADTDGYSLRSPMSRMGSMSLFNRAEPDGYSEFGPPWISAGTLAERLRFVQAMLIAPGQSGRTDAGTTYANPVALLQARLPSSSWSDAEAVADLFLGLLFPAEGRANLSPYRERAVAFLNDGSTDSPRASNTPFSELAVSNAANSAYDVRVRGLVASLMTSQRFHEQ